MPRLLSERKDLTEGPWTRLARPARPATARAMLAGSLLALWLPAAPAEMPAGPGPQYAEQLAECRFLTARGEGEEARVPLDPDRMAALFAVLRRTRVGGMVASALEKFRAEGIGGPDRPLRLVEVRRAGGPAAEYFETGELAVGSSLVEGLSGETAEDRSRLYTAASFVVHEGAHAIAHHLSLKGAFPFYRPDTKVNEALAFFVQGLFLDEIREHDPDYREPETVAAWDACTAHIVRILRDFGVAPDASFDDAYDRFAEWQLESDDTTALRLSKLWQYFQFIQASGEAEALWRLGEAEPPRTRVVESLTAMIASDVEQRNCDLQRTFAFMRDRIILYAHYEDTPADATACQYFAGFVQGLRSEREISEVLHGQIDRWLARRGLGKPREAAP
jgi:hypothetical protein